MTQIRKRRVFYVSGFDPRGATAYHRMFMEESQKHAAQRGVSLQVGKRRREGPLCTTWEVMRTEGDLASLGLTVADIRNAVASVAEFAPTSLSATPASGPSADLSWTAPAGEWAIHYRVYRSAVSGGPYALRRTIVSVRVNPDSPYRVAREADGALRLSLEGRTVADVGLPPMPEYYRHRLENGKGVMEIAPTIQWGYLIYLTVLRLCQYFGAKEECQYCDINHNWRQHKQEGRPYTGVKPVDEVLEALAIIDRHDTARASQAYTLTGGSVTSRVDGLAEADFYGRYAQAIEERFPGRWIGKVVAQALRSA